MIRSATKEDASRLAEILIFAKRMAYGNIFTSDKKLEDGATEYILKYQKEL